MAMMNRMMPPRKTQRRLLDVEKPQKRIAEEVEEQHDGEGEHEFAADDGPLARRGVFAEYGEAGGGVADRVHDEKEGQGHFEGVLHGEGLEHGCVG